MTVVAGIAADNMSLILAGSGNAIMTSTTIAEYLGVIDSHCRREYIGRMAVFADVGCQNVRWGLADCFRTVVASETVIRDVCMVKIRRQPGN